MKRQDFTQPSFGLVMRARVLGALLVAASLTAALPARAQLEFGIDEPRIFSIQPRPYVLGHEFNLAAGVMPLDAFYVGLVLGGSYTYHFTDFWAWEIASVHYSINFDTSLERNLLEEFGVIPVRGGGERTQLFLSTAAVAKPFFGKLVLFNRTIVYAESFFTAGLGPFQSVSGTGESSYFDPALMVGFGLRFWSNDAVSVRFEVRDYIVFKNIFVRQDNLTRQEEGVENTLLFQLSASLNFTNVFGDDSPKPNEDGLFGGDRALSSPSSIASFGAR